jgi:hypothetical protein
VFYVAPDGRILDDNMGGGHSPYALDARGQRHAVPPQIASVLASRWEASLATQPAQARQPAPPPMPVAPEAIAEMRSMFPIGDLIAKLTSSVGIQPCEPCKRRQEMLNAIGDRMARRVWNR